MALRSGTMNVEYSPVHPRNADGFTLLELMVSLAVTVILAGVLITANRASLDLWEKSMDRLTTVSRAEAILDQIERDLLSAVWRADGNVWFAATVPADTTLSGWWVGGATTKPTSTESWSLDEPHIQDCRFGVAGVWLRFFRAGETDGIAALRAVGYQLVRRPFTSVTTEHAYLLHRPEVTAANTFSAGYDLDPVAGGYTLRSAVVGNPGNLLRPALGQVTGDHVVDFGVRCFVRGPGGYERVFPTSSDTEYLAGSEDQPMPQMIEVMIRLLEPAGVQRLQAYEAGALEAEAPTDWWTLVEMHSRVVVRRIVLPDYP